MMRSGAVWLILWQQEECYETRPLSTLPTSIEPLRQVFGDDDSVKTFHSLSCSSWLRVALIDSFVHVNFCG